MAEPVPFVQITPDHLNFPPPFDRVIAQTLQLKNTNPSTTIAYKVRTTSPKRYMVKPGTGYITPQSTVDIKVYLQIMKDPPQTQELKTFKDKFQIQELDIPNFPHNAGESEKQDFVKTFWENAPKDAPRSQKLKCSFLVEDEVAKPSSKLAGSQTGSSGALTAGGDDDKSVRFKAEVHRLKRELEKVQREKASLEKAAADKAGLGSYAPLVVAFFLGFFISKLVF